MMGREEQHTKSGVSSYFYFGWPFAIEQEQAQGKRKEEDSFDPDRYERELTSLGWRRLGKADDPDYAARPSGTAIASRPIPSSASFVDRYAVWQYLSNDGRQVFRDLDPNGEASERMGDGGILCRLYQLDIDPSKSTYLIKKTFGSGSSSKLLSYRLTVDEVDLHVYSFGCGIVWLRTHGDYTEPEDTKNIAEYGRRITLPFLPDGDADGYTLCADQLKVTLASASRRWTLSFDSRAGIKNLGVGSGKTRALPSSNDFFQEILGMGGYSLRPLNDDRMFVMELVRNEDISTRLKSGSQLRTRAWYEDEDLQKSLYEYVYVDQDGGCSCQDYQQRRELLDEAVMPWWADYGTIHASSSYSFVCVTGEDSGIDASVVRPFLNEYIFLCSLVLAQRMGIAQYSLRAGDIARETKVLGSEQSQKRLSSLQGEFVSFENQALVNEVSNQQQGIAIYQLLRRQLLVDAEQAELNEQLSELYEVVNTGVGDKLARVGIALALLAIFVDFLKDFIETWSTKDGSTDFFYLSVGLLSLAIAIGLISYVFIYKQFNILTMIKNVLRLNKERNK